MAVALGSASDSISHTHRSITPGELRIVADQITHLRSVTSFRATVPRMSLQT